MNKFTAGLVTGSALGMLALTYVMKDKRTRRMMANDGQKLMEKANDAIENMTDMF